MNESRKNINNKIEQSKGIHINEIDEVLLDILEKESQQRNTKIINQGYSLSARKNNILIDMKSIALTRVAVTFLKFIQPFDLHRRIQIYKSLKYKYTDQKQVLIRFFEPRYQISKLVYTVFKFTLKDEFNYGLKNTFSTQISQNPLYSVGLNYIAGGLSAISAFHLELFYNILVQPNQSFEQENKFKTILSRFKLNSRFQRLIYSFSSNKILFSSIYLGTFDTLNSSSKNNNSTFSLLYYSIMSSLLAQIVGDTLQKAKIAFMTNYQPANNVNIACLKYSNWVKAMFLYYVKHPSKLLENNNRFFHRLFFNSITLCYYEWFKGYYSGSNKY